MKIYSNEDEQSIKILKVIGYLVFKYIKTKYINLAEQKKSNCKSSIFLSCVKKFQKLQAVRFHQTLQFH